MPSAKKAFAGSGLRLVNGSTARRMADGRPCTRLARAARRWGA